MKTMMTSSTPVNLFNSLQIFQMLLNIIFCLVFCNFKAISDKVTANDDVT